MKKIKDFISANFKQFRKFWVNQIAISLLGVMVTLPVTLLEKNYPDLGNWPELLCAAFAGGMFCFLVYDVFYELGAKDYIKVNHQNIKEDKLKAVKISVLAYTPTIIVALCGIVFYLANLGSAYAIVSLIMNMCIHAMYSGLFFFIPDSFNVIAFPVGIAITVLFSHLGYTLAMKNKSLRGIFGISVKPYRE